MTVAERITVCEREPDPGQQWKCGDEFLPFHPQASHVEPAYRDGWNRCYWMAVSRGAKGNDELSRIANLSEAKRKDAMYREADPACFVCSGTREHPREAGEACPNCTSGVKWDDRG